MSPVLRGELCEQGLFYRPTRRAWRARISLWRALKAAGSANSKPVCTGWKIKSFCDAFPPDQRMGAMLHSIFCAEDRRLLISPGVHGPRTFMTEAKRTKS